MKYVILGERYFHYVDSIAETLTEMGNDVILEYIPLIDKDKMKLLEYLRYKFNKKKYKEEWVNSTIEKLKRIIVDERPDCFIAFASNYKMEFVNDELLRTLKNNAVKCISWYIDTIKRYENSVEQHISEFDEIYVFEPSDVGYIKERYNKIATWVPGFVDEKIYCNNNDLNINKKYDLCFVGNGTPKRLAYLEKIAEFCYNNNLRMIVYGNYYNQGKCWSRWFNSVKFANRYKHLSKYLINDSLNPTDVSKLYLESKICLNMHIEVHKGFNFRTFEILGNGNFEICDNKDNLVALDLKDSYDIVFYDSVDDCIKKISKYVINDDLRSEIGMHGRDYVMENYTCEKVIAKFTKLM